MRRTLRRQPRRGPGAMSAPQEDRPVPRDRRAAVRAARRTLVPPSSRTAGASLAMVRDRWLRRHARGRRAGDEMLTALAARCRRAAAASLSAAGHGERRPSTTRSPAVGGLNRRSTPRGPSWCGACRGRRAERRWMEQQVERSAGGWIDPIAFIGGGALSPLWRRRSRTCSSGGPRSPTRVTRTSAAPRSRPGSRWANSPPRT